MSPQPTLGRLTKAAVERHTAAARKADSDEKSVRPANTPAPPSQAGETNDAFASTERKPPGPPTEVVAVTERRGRQTPSKENGRKAVVPRTDRKAFLCVVTAFANTVPPQVLLYCILSLVFPVVSFHVSECWAVDVNGTVYDYEYSVQSGALCVKTVEDETRVPQAVRLCTSDLTVVKNALFYQRLLRPWYFGIIATVFAAIGLLVHLVRRILTTSPRVATAQKLLHIICCLFVICFQAAAVAYSSRLYVDAEFGVISDVRKVPLQVERYTHEDISTQRITYVGRQEGWIFFIIAIVFASVSSLTTAAELCFVAPSSARHGERGTSTKHRRLFDWHGLRTAGFAALVFVLLLVANFTTLAANETISYGTWWWCFGEWCAQATDVADQAASCTDLVRLVRIHQAFQIIAPAVASVLFVMGLIEAAWPSRSCQICLRLSRLAAAMTLFASCMTSASSAAVLTTDTECDGTVAGLDIPIDTTSHSGAAILLGFVASAVAALVGVFALWDLCTRSPPPAEAEASSSDPDIPHSESLPSPRKRSVAN
jgi:hypothetical protein